MKRALSHPSPNRTESGRFLLLAAACLLAVPAWADADDALFRKARSTYERELEAIHQKYREENPAYYADKYRELLTDYVEAARAEGELEELIASRNELERFEQTGSLTESDIVTEPRNVRRLQGNYFNAIRKNEHAMLMEEAQLAKSYWSYLDRLKRNLTRQDQIQQALAVAEEAKHILEAVDFGVLDAPPQIPHVDTTPPAASFPESQGTSVAQPSIPNNKIVVRATRMGRLGRGIEVEIHSQGFNKHDAETTDLRGVATFNIFPELAYTVNVLDDRFVPFVQRDCKGGTMVTVNLVPLPPGLVVVKLDRGNDINLPGISLIKISSAYSSVDGTRGFTLAPTTPRTQFSASYIQIDRIRLEDGEWTTVTEGSNAIEFRLLSLYDSGERIAIYRQL